MKKQQNNRVAIVGCRRVQAGSVQSLLLGAVVDELVLIGEGAQPLLAAINDLQQSLPVERKIRMWAGNYRDTAAAKIAVISAATEVAPGAEPLSTLQKNIALIREVMRGLKKAGFGGVVLMTTNPVDVLAQAALEESGFEPEKVIGSGAALNDARRRALVASPGSRRAVREQIAEMREEEAEIITWCAARTGGSPLVDFCTPDCPDFGKMLDRLTRTAQVDLPHQGYMSSGVGSCVSKICQAVLENERAILPVSTLTGGQYGISGVYLTLPCVIGAGGVERALETPLAEDERRRLLETAHLLKNTLADLRAGSLKGSLPETERR